MDNFTIAEVQSRFDEALRCADCPEDFESWFDSDESMEVPDFIWLAVRALSKYAESLEDEEE